MKGIVAFVGPAGAGKTTFCRMMATILTEKHPDQSILWVSAKADSEISLFGKTVHIAQPLTALMQNIQDYSSQDQEQLDWAFSDCVVSVNDVVDVLAVGSLPTNLSPAVENLLTYGFNRLVAQYDFVLIDGNCGLLQERLQAHDLFRTVCMLTPQVALEEPTLSVLKQLPPHPMIILNRMPTPSEASEGLTRWVYGMVSEHAGQLVGQFPFYEGFSVETPALVERFRDCLYRMDLPVGFL